MTDERGLVISCPIEFDGTCFHIKQQRLNSQALRASLLFWDKLDFPHNRIMSIGLDPDGQFLYSQGILRRTEVSVPPAGDVGAVHVQAHINAYQQLDRSEPGVWSLAVDENSVSFPNESIQQGRGVLVRLYNSIPVPAKDVPIQNVLEFRHKHRDELLALRHHLERLYQKILESADGELALNTEISALEQAIADHIKRSKEIKLPFVSMSLDASLNIPAGVVARTAAQTMSFDLLETLVTGLAAAISFGPGASLKGRRTDATPFQYVSSFHKKIF